MFGTARAGAITGVVLCFSAVGSAVFSINTYRHHLLGVTPNAITAVVFLATLATMLSAYLAINVWTKGSTWANATLLIWAALFSLAPNILYPSLHILYPSLLPRLVLLGCVTVSTTALRASRKHQLS